MHDKAMQYDLQCQEHGPVQIACKWFIKAMRLCRSLRALLCLNAGQIWPYLDNAVSAVARQKIEPKLQEHRAPWMMDITVEQ